VTDKNAYYNTMMAGDRAMVFKYEDGVKCIITYFIGMLYDRNRFVNKEPWTIVPDNVDGSVCYVDQMITDKEDNHTYSKKVWGMLVDHILNKYKDVKQITWNRYKGGVVHVYSKSIR